MGKHTATKTKPATMAQPVDHGTAGHNPRPKEEKPSRAKAAAKGAAEGAIAGPEGAAAGAAGGALFGGGGGGGGGGREVRTYSASNKALVAEFVICMAMLGLTPLVNKGADITVTKFMKKASATAAVFIILGFISAGGGSAQKVAQGLGLLVTLTVLLNERSAFGQLVKAVSGKDAAAKA